MKIKCNNTMHDMHYTVTLFIPYNNLIESIVDIRKWINNSPRHFLLSKFQDEVFPLSWWKNSHININFNPSARKNSTHIWCFFVWSRLYTIHSLEYNIQQSKISLILTIISVYDNPVRKKFIYEWKFTFFFHLTKQCKGE